MQVTKDPRCPTHPAYEVTMCWRATWHWSGQMLPVWMCEVCDRVLGLAPPSLLSLIKTAIAPVSILGQLSREKRLELYEFAAGVDEVSGGDDE